MHKNIKYKAYTKYIHIDKENTETKHHIENMGTNKENVIKT